MNAVDRSGKNLQKNNTCVTFQTLPPKFMRQNFDTAPQLFHEHVLVAKKPPAKPKHAGSQIAHFELIERLGAGAMGEAWKAWDTRLKRNVTIKLPHINSLTDSDLRRFLREGEAAAQLSHPQLACVHEMGTTATRSTS